jgi:hypothetical protein
MRIQCMLSLSGSVAGGGGLWGVTSRLVVRACEGVSEFESLRIVGRRGRRHGGSGRRRQGGR